MVKHRNCCSLARGRDVILLGTDSEVLVVDALLMIIMTVIPDDLDFRLIAFDTTGESGVKK